MQSFIKLIEYMSKHGDSVSLRTGRHDESEIVYSGGDRLGRHWQIKATLASFSDKEINDASSLLLDKAIKRRLTQTPFPANAPFP